MSTAIHDTSHPRRLCMDIHKCIYLHIGCIDWLEFQVLQSSTLIYSCICSYISSNINNLKYIRHYGWGQLYDAASLATQTIRATSTHLSGNVFLLMQEHMQREEQPYLYRYRWLNIANTKDTKRGTNTSNAVQHIVDNMCICRPRARDWDGFTNMDVSCTR